MPSFEVAECCSTDSPSASKQRRQRLDDFAAVPPAVGRAYSVVGVSEVVGRRGSSRPLVAVDRRSRRCRGAAAASISLRRPSRRRRGGEATSAALRRCRASSTSRWSRVVLDILRASARGPARTRRRSRARRRGSVELDREQRAGGIRAAPSTFQRVASCTSEPARGARALASIGHVERHQAAVRRDRKPRCSKKVERADRRSRARTSRASVDGRRRRPRPSGLPSKTVIGARERRAALPVASRCAGSPSRSSSPAPKSVPTRACRGRARPRCSWPPGRKKPPSTNARDSRSNSRTTAASAPPRDRPPGTAGISGAQARRRPCQTQFSSSAAASASMSSTVSHAGSACGTLQRRPPPDAALVLGVLPEVVDPVPADRRIVDLVLGLEDLERVRIDRIVDGSLAERGERGVALFPDPRHRTLPLDLLQPEVGIVRFLRRGSDRDRERGQDEEEQALGSVHLADWTQPMIATFTMSSAEAPREMSCIGAARPWRSGPSAVIPPNRCAIL